MSEIKSVVVVTAKPASRGDLGQCEEGHYTVENGMLTIVTREGEPLRDDNNGERITVRLFPGDDEKVVAKKLTLRRYREAHRDELAGFHRPIRYRDSAY
jgi:hypothetical protein